MLLKLNPNNTAAAEGLKFAETKILSSSSCRSGPSINFDQVSVPLEPTAEEIISKQEEELKRLSSRVKEEEEARVKEIARAAGRGQKKRTCPRSRKESNQIGLGEGRQSSLPIKKSSGS